MASDANKLNPQHVKGKSEYEIVTFLHYEAKKLLNFNYHNFTPELIRWLNNELPNMVAEYNRYHDFDKLLTSNKFQTRIHKIIKRKKLDPNIRLTWETGDAEYSCKIWEWWRGSRCDLPCFALALRLVVLSQMSICFVEQLFLCLKRA